VFPLLVTFREFLCHDQIHHRRSGVFLTTLTFIQDGAEDNISGNVVNFRKRQKASEVIRDIKRWQSPPFNFQPVPSIQAYLDESLKQFTESVELGDHFWNLSLEREPREREDEKMARLLQESGFVRDPL
jgi:son of sevenless-like protein